MISAPIAGSVSDHVGRVPMLLFSLVGTSACFLVIFFAASWEIILIAYICAGFCGNSVAVCSALIADVIAKPSLPFFYALNGSVLQFAFVAGPAISGVLTIVSLEAPFLAVSVFGALVFVALTAVSNKECCARARPPRMSSSIDDHGKDYHGVCKLEILFFFYVIGCMWSATGSWASMNIVFVHARLLWGPAHFGVASACINMIVIVYQIKLQPRLVKTLGPRRCYTFAVAGASGAYLGFASVAWLPVAHLLAAPLFCFFYLLLTFGMHTATSCVSIMMMTDYATPKTRGLLAGLLNTTRMLAMAVSPLVYLRVFQAGHADIGWLCASALALIGCVSFVAGPTHGCARPRATTSA